MINFASDFLNHRIRNRFNRNDGQGAFDRGHFCALNNSDVSAPVTIQVRSTGADAEQVGRSLYDTAERYLLRTLRGVMA